MATMMLGVLETVMHIGMIKMFRLPRFYSPGLASVFAQVKDDALYIGKLAMRAGLRGAGIGRKLVEAAPRRGAQPRPQDARTANPDRTHGESRDVRADGIREDRRNGASPLRPPDQHYHACEGLNSLVASLPSPERRRSRVSLLRETGASVPHVSNKRLMAIRR